MGVAQGFMHPPPKKKKVKDGFYAVARAKVILLWPWLFLKLDFNYMMKHGG